MVETTDQKFEQGQFLLDPEFGKSKEPVLWSVGKVKPNGKADLVAHFEAFTAVVETSVDRIPVNWEVISQKTVIEALSKAGALVARQEEKTDG